MKAIFFALFFYLELKNKTPKLLLLGTKCFQKQQTTKIYCINSLKMPCVSIRFICSLFINSVVAYSTPGFARPFNTCR